MMSVAVQPGSIQFKQAYVIDNTCKLVSHLIMEIAGNLLSQSFQLIHPDPFYIQHLLNALTHAQVQQQRDTSRDEYDNACYERGGLIERALDRKCIGDLVIRPVTFWIGGHHPEYILSGRQVAVGYLR